MSNEVASEPEFSDPGLVEFANTVNSHTRYGMHESELLALAKRRGIDLEALTRDGVLHLYGTTAQWCYKIRAGSRVKLCSEIGGSSVWSGPGDEGA